MRYKPYKNNKRKIRELKEINKEESELIWIPANVLNVLLFNRSQNVTHI